MRESPKGRGVSYIKIQVEAERRAHMVPILEIGLKNEPQEMEVRR